MATKMGDYTLPFDNWKGEPTQTKNKMEQNNQLPPMNSNGKIIISTNALYSFLSNKMEFWKDEVKIAGIDDELIIDGFKGLLCHIKAPFECNMETVKLRRLKNLLGEMTDQPVTIAFDGFKIEIQSITI